MSAYTHTDSVRKTHPHVTTDFSGCEESLKLAEE